jgi:hypothetical protein
VGRSFDSTLSFGVTPAAPERKEVMADDRNEREETAPADESAERDDVEEREVEGHIFTTTTTTTTLTTTE